jgi:hypothetical protein
MHVTPMGTLSVMVEYPANKDTSKMYTLNGVIYFVSVVTLLDFIYHLFAEVKVKHTV